MEKFPPAAPGGLTGRQACGKLLRMEGSGFNRVCIPARNRLAARLALALALLAAGGCAGIPRRQAGVAGRYPARPAPPAAAGPAAIPSEYQDHAGRALAESTPESPVHYAQLLSTGDDALLARIHLIRAATRSIDL